MIKHYPRTSIHDLAHTRRPRALEVPCFGQSSCRHHPSRKTAPIPRVWICKIKSRIHFQINKPVLPIPSNMGSPRTKLRPATACLRKYTIKKKRISFGSTASFSGINGRMFLRNSAVNFQADHAVAMEDLKAGSEDFSRKKRCPLPKRKTRAGSMGERVGKPFPIRVARVLFIYASTRGCWKLPVPNPKFKVILKRIAGIRLCLLKTQDIPFRNSIAIGMFYIQPSSVSLKRKRIW